MSAFFEMDFHYILICIMNSVTRCLISPKHAPKVAYTLYMIVALLEIAQKITKICGLLLCDNLLPRTCKNRQIWSHTDHELGHSTLEVVGLLQNFESV